MERRNKWQGHQELGEQGQDVLTEEHDAEGPQEDRQQEELSTDSLAEAVEAAEAEAAEAEAEAVAEAVEFEVDIETEKSKVLCEQISQISLGVCFLGFSRGKDSIASWIYLKKFFKRIIPFHVASVPHLKFVDESLEYYEDFFKTKIHRFMDGSVLKSLWNLQYQPPGSDEEIDRLNLIEFDKHFIVDHMRNKFDIPYAWVAFGINASDSIDRRIYVNKYEGRIDSNKSFYPCYDWKKSLIMDQILRSGVKLPKDYLLANRTLAEVPRYRHLMRMKNVLPDDFDRIKLMFPMIEAEISRNEFRQEKFSSNQKDLPDQG
jgi:hypothetical protein